MFIIHLPPEINVGDTVDVRINGQPQRLTFRDHQTVVIGDSDARHILERRIVSDATHGKLYRFICADADGEMSYEIMLAYEPDDGSDDLPDAVADELRMGFPHTSNWPCFGILALDFIRTLEWTVQSLPGDPINIFARFRDCVPTLRGFAIYRTHAARGSLPLFAWQAHDWVEAWEPPAGFLNPKGD